MAIILQLKVNVFSYKLGQLSKTTKITQELYDELKPLMRDIMEYKKTDRYNFSRATALYIEDNRWVTKYKVEKIYSAHADKIEKFMKFVPQHVDGIYSFELIKTETVDTIA